MANTLTLTVSALYTPDGQTTQLRLLEVAGRQFSITSNLIAGGIQNIGTSAENLDFGAVTSEGWAFFWNMDDTNYVEIGWDATGFQSAIMLYPGEAYPVRLNSARTWQAKANTAAIDLYFQVCGSP